MGTGHTMDSAMEILNRPFRTLMDREGLSDVHLIKADGYFYIYADGEHERSLTTKQTTSIYLNSFNQQSARQWVEDIKNIINKP